MSLPLFVYGTLMAGQERAALLSGSRVSATARGQLFDLPAGYPAMTLVGTDWVHGELVALDDPRVLSVLDTYEGVSEGLYRRVEIDVVVALRAQRAWAYVMDPARARIGRVVTSGRWRRRRRTAG